MRKSLQENVLDTPIAEQVYNTKKNISYFKFFCGGQKSSDEKVANQSKICSDVKSCVEMEVNVSRKNGKNIYKYLAIGLSKEKRMNMESGCKWHEKFIDLSTFWYQFASFGQQFVFKI